MGYMQLGLSERYQIYELLKRHWSVPQVAEWMRRSPSTIYRELNRNRGQNGWRPAQAHNLATLRRCGKSGPRLTGEIWSEVDRLLRHDWSPEQISRRLRLEGSVRISHEWIYQHVYRNRRQGGRLHLHLRQQKPYRRRLGKYGKRSLLKDTVSIEQRTRQAISRHWFGHWEGDTVVGKGQQGALLTLVERKSRYSLVRRLQNRQSEGVRKTVVEALLPIQHRVKTITYDNGREFADHKRMEADLDARVYFAHPYASWERVTNENTNGLLRQYFPRQRSLLTVTEQEIAQAQDRLNLRPRKCLGFKTPQEVFVEEKLQLTVALTS